METEINMKYKLLVLFVFAQLVEGRVYVNFVKGTSNPVYLANFTAAVRNDSEGISRIDLSALLKVDLAKVLFFFNVMIKSSEFSYAFDRTLLKGTIDACKPFDGLAGSFMTKAIFTNISNFTNLDFKCPFHRGFRFLKDFPIHVDVPLSMVGKSRAWEYNMVAKARIQVNKPMVHIFTIKLNGDAD